VRYIKKKEKMKHVQLFEGFLQGHTDTLSLCDSVLSGEIAVGYAFENEGGVAILNQNSPETGEIINLLEAFQAKHPDIFFYTTSTSSGVSFITISGEAQDGLDLNTHSSSQGAAASRDIELWFDANTESVKTNSQGKDLYTTISNLKKGMMFKHSVAYDQYEVSLISPRAWIDAMTIELNG
jgi:hypothetical protein